MNLLNNYILSPILYVLGFIFGLLSLPFLLILNYVNKPSTREIVAPKAKGSFNICEEIGYVTTAPHARKSDYYSNGIRKSGLMTEVERTVN